MYYVLVMVRLKNACFRTLLILKKRGGIPSPCITSNFNLTCRSTVYSVFSICCQKGIVCHLIMWPWTCRCLMPETVQQPTECTTTSATTSNMPLTKGIWGTHTLNSIDAFLQALSPSFSLSLVHLSLARPHDGLPHPLLLSRLDPLSNLSLRSVTSLELCAACCHWCDWLTPDLLLLIITCVPSC